MKARWRYVSGFKKTLYLDFRGKLTNLSKHPLEFKCASTLQVHLQGEPKPFEVEDPNVCGQGLGVDQDVDATAEVDIKTLLFSPQVPSVLQQYTVKDVRWTVRIRAQNLLGERHDWILFRAPLAPLSIREWFDIVPEGSVASVNAPEPQFEIHESMLVAASRSAASRKSGAKTFAKYCSVCHGKDGEGLVGPNLTDHHWLIGDGSLMAIKHRVAKGNAKKGCPPWDGILTSPELIDISAFVASLQGSRSGNEPPDPEGKQMRR